MKGHLNKPIYAIMTSLVLVLGTFAIAFPPQEASAGGALSVKLEITCKEIGNNPSIRAFAFVVFFGENKFRIDAVSTAFCNFDGDMSSLIHEIPPGTTEILFGAFCLSGITDNDISESEKKFREGQTSFEGKVICKAEGGSAKAQLTTNFTP